MNEELPLNRFSSKYKSFLENKGFHKYGKNTLWLISEKVLRMIFGLLIGVWVARYLGPEKFGMLSYAISFVALFSALSTLGLDSIVVRELVKDSKKENIVLGTAFSLRFIGAIVVLILVTLSTFIYSEGYESDEIILVLAATTLVQSFSVIDFYFQSNVKGKYVAISNVISLLFSSLIKILLIVSHAGLEFFAYVIFIEMSILSISYIYFYVSKGSSILKWSFDKSTALNLLKDSWPLILSSLVVTLYMKVDQIMINKMIGPESVGYYTAATRLSEVWYFIPVVICNSLFPAILNAKERSKELYLKRLQNLYDFILWLALAIALFVTLISNPLIDILYGKEYASSSSVLLVHIWSSVFVFLGVASSKWFIAEGLQKQALYRTLAGLGVNVFLNLLLIGSYGAIGAAIATLLSQIVASYLFNVFSIKTRGMFIMQSKSFLFPVRIFKVIFSK
ncbi:flippase [Vibrio furnissii]|uniref:flippase n=1 Tax=Vibrio furnissii TaxID=29494 RepID=UPI00130273C5|nr:flippase [Vibrio furnissii]